jgi:hypothetical protein
MAGAAGIAAVGVAAGRRLAESRAAAAVERELASEGPEVVLHGERLRLPVAYHRSDGFFAIVGADPDRVSKALPSERLRPVRLAGDRAAVYVGVYRYHDITMHTADGRTLGVRPYGEVIVAALVTRRPAPPVLPVLAPKAFSMGAFVLHLPVTTRFARDGGVAWWGLPKFVADMDFTDDELERAVILREGGRRILTLTVRPSGRPVIDRSGTVLYSSLAGSLLEIVVPGVEVRRDRLGPSGGSVELGDHPVADELRGLGLADRPFATATILAARFVLPEGHPIGPACDYRGYAGTERELGRYTASHAGTPAIDLDAAWRPLQSWPVGPGTPAAPEVPPEAAAPPEEVRAATAR